MKYHFLISCFLVHVGLLAQVDNTMYGLYQSVNPPGFQMASIDPSTGVITTIGSAVLSNTVNATGSALNPYSQTFSYQDDDSWLSIDLQSGEVVNDVMVTLPNTNGYFDNFRFNAADSNMYGLFRQVGFDPITGFFSGDIRLATCDLSSGIVNLISSNSIAESFTMSGSTIDPFQMLYHFESEGKFMGIDLYNGEIYSQPTITIAGDGSSFDNFAYSCVDTSIYGLIMQNGVNALGKINPLTGIVTPLPTLLNFGNYVLNSGGAIDPENRIYYFQTMDSIGVKLVGLSLLDGSVASESYLDSNSYFIMYRIQSDCYRANRARLNLITSKADNNAPRVKVYPNPAQEVLNLKSDTPMDHVEIIDAMGRVVRTYHPNETEFQISVMSLSKGLYHLRFRSSNAYFTERFFKN
jgi:hypothetical protein